MLKLYSLIKFSVSMEVQDSFRLVQSFDYADIYVVENLPVLIIEATAGYIPIDEFKKIFVRAEEVVRSKGVQKIIFDKRKLEVFHQPSMEWYFTTWKETLLELGVKTHRKLLPDDPTFRKSVEIGRMKIQEKHPNLHTGEMDIRYAQNLEEAISE